MKYFTISKILFFKTKIKIIKNKNRQRLNKTIPNSKKNELYLNIMFYVIF